MIIRDSATSAYESGAGLQRHARLNSSQKNHARQNDKRFLLRPTTVQEFLEMPISKNAADAEQRLKELGINLPRAPNPLGAYVETVQTGNLLFLSGSLPVEAGRPKYVGRIGDDLSIEDGRRAAALAAMNALALAKEHLGSLNNVRKAVRLRVSLVTTDDFREHPKFADAASELFLNVFCAENISSRLGLGMGNLPLRMRGEL